MDSKHVLCVAALALTVLGVGAQTQAPGLWEHTMNMKSKGGEMEQAMAEMQKQMAAMSPDQRKQMEQMVSGRGVSMGSKGTTVKVCISKEQAARPAEPKLADGCTQQVDRRSGNTIKFKFECSKPEPSSGDGEVTFQSNKAYTGKSMVTTQAKGHAGQQMSMEMSGKWLSADCGDIKPRVSLAK